MGAGAAKRPFADMRCLSIVCFRRTLGIAAPGHKQALTDADWASASRLVAVIRPVYGHSRHSDPNAALAIAQTTRSSRPPQRTFVARTERRTLSPLFTAVGGDVGLSLLDYRGHCNVPR